MGLGVNREPGERCAHGVEIIETEPTNLHIRNQPTPLPAFKGSTRRAHFFREERHEARFAADELIGVHLIKRWVTTRAFN